MTNNQAGIESLKKKIQGKTRLLSFISEETNEILKEKNYEAVSRQLEIYQKRVNEIQDLKLNIQELMLEDGEDPSEVRTWSNKIAAEIKNYEPIIAEMKTAMVEIKRETQKTVENTILVAKQKLFQQEREFKQARFEEKIKQERKLAEVKGATTRPPEKGKMETKVKLPKLIITKIQGTHLDWYRFWNQYEAEIDKADIDSVAKF